MEREVMDIDDEIIDAVANSNFKSLGDTSLMFLKMMAKMAANQEATLPFGTSTEVKEIEKETEKEIEDREEYLTKTKRKIQI